MAYTIYNTDGSVLLTLGEGKVDEKNTSLALIGKNVSSYGEYLNENLVKLLANFAGTDEPRSPLVGQLWYDTASGRMKVYDLNSIFRPITNTLSADAQPVELANNDFWWDTRNEQLKFTPDGQTIYTVGPIDSSVFGTTGWVAESIKDDSGNPHIVTSLYNSGQRLGILSADSFTFAATTSGMTAVSIGLNLNSSIAGIKFVGTATSADSISGLDVGEFLRNNINQTTTGSFTVNSDLGFQVSNSVLDGFTISADPDTHLGSLSYNSTDRDFSIKVVNGTVGLTSVFFTRAATEHMGIWNESPIYPVDIVGDTRIQGNLIVQGTLTNITSVDLKIVDKNIELATGQSSPLDTNANGGGITLHGTTDHSITWKNNSTGWNFNDNVNLFADPNTFTNVTASGSVGASAAFDISRVDGLYAVTIVNSGTSYTSAATIDRWSTSTPFITSWSTSTPYVGKYSTSTNSATYVSLTGTNISGVGTGLSLNILSYFDVGAMTYDIDNVQTGTNYQVNDVITIAGSLVGGVTPANDVLLTVAQVNGFGSIVEFVIGGTPAWSTSTPFITWTTSTPLNSVWSTSTPFIYIPNANSLTVTGNNIGGTTPENDLSITVTSVNTGGSIIAFTSTGASPTGVYKISSSTVITKTSLGQGIVTAPGLVTVGVMSHLTVTNIQLLGNTISTIGTNQTLYFNASGTANIDVSSNKITSLADPTSDNDAANKKYVDDILYKTQFGSTALTVDATNFGDLDQSNPQILAILEAMYPIDNLLDPVFDIPAGSRAKVLCGITSIPTNTATITISPTSNILVDKGGVQNTATVVSGASGSIAAQLPPQTYIPVTTYPKVQTYSVVRPIGSTPYWNYVGTETISI